LRFAAVAALSCLAVAAASAQTPAPVTDSSSQAGARPVALTFRVPAELQCGHPRASSLKLTFPTEMVMPATVSASDVLVDGKRAASVTRAGRQLTVRITPPSGIQCDVISQGTVTVAVGKGAGLGNPRRTGAYAFYGTVNGQLPAKETGVVIHFS
jgi:hypothetical protein